MKSDKRLPYGYVEYLAKPILFNYDGQVNEDVQPYSRPPNCMPVMRVGTLIIWFGGKMDCGCVRSGTARNER